MNEPQRQAYLHLLQIDSYLPRFRLPGAKSSRLAPAPTGAETAPEAAVTGARSEPAPDAAAPTAPAMATVAVEPPASPRSSPPETAAESPSPRPAAAAETVQFKLRLYRVGPELAILDEIPYLSQENRQQQRSQRQLLGNIVAALGLDPQAIESGGEFCWPVHADLSPTETAPAWRGLNGYIRGRQESLGFTHLIVLAGGCAELVRSGLETQGDGLIWPGIEANNGGLTVTLTHSLTAMLSIPRLKREVWQSLRPLAGRFPG